MAKYSLSIVLNPILSLECDIDTDIFDELDCPYNRDYNVECKKFYDEYVDVEQLSASDIKKIRIKAGGASGAYGNVLFSKLNNRDIAIKIQGINKDLGSNYSSYRSEICATQKASVYGLAPKVLAYWKCEPECVIVMERIMGITLVEYIKQYCILSDRETIMNVYLRVIRAALRLNWEAGILHGDVNFDNIMIDTNDEVKFIDFGLSYVMGKYRVDEDGIYFADNSFYDVIGVTERMVTYNQIYGRGKSNLTLKSFIDIVKKNLYTKNNGYIQFMPNIFRDFYATHGRIPSVDEAMKALMTKLDI